MKSNEQLRVKVDLTAKDHAQAKVMLQGIISEVGRHQAHEDEKTQGVFGNQCQSGVYFIRKVIKK